MDFKTFVQENGKPMSFAVGRHLFRQGDLDRSIYLLRQGLLKAYYLSDDGRETIKSFILPGDHIGSLTAAYRGEACTFSLVALEPTETVAIEFDELYGASQNDIGIAGAAIDFLLAFAMKKERRERELLTESAEARYRMLLEDTPGLFEKVRQKDIARYLGITPVALSRIRARIARPDG